MHLSSRFLAAASAAMAMALWSPLAAARDTSPLAPPVRTLQPDTWPQPDFFSEAVGHSALKPAARFRALGLASMPAQPSLRVMPVQMQAYGWTRQFAALVGARLDRALADRGVSANRQTDLFDLDGPFARRFTDAETQAFAAKAPGTPLLALFIGRDAEKQVFVTLTLRRDDRELKAHRSVPERSGVRDVLQSVSDVFPAMLSELGLAGTPPAPQAPRRCQASDWALADPVAGETRAGRACRAVIVGMLMPTLDWDSSIHPGTRSPAHLAALAEAYVEADALEAASADAVRAVSWAWLELELSRHALGAFVDVDDPVLKPLVRLAWAAVRSHRQPVRSRKQAQAQYTEQAGAELPPFAQAAYTEVANLFDTFRRVEICALEQQVLAMKLPAECEPSTAPRPARLATKAQRALLEHWRFARHFKDLMIEAQFRNDTRARQRVLDAMPAQTAAHPFMRQLRFKTENFDDARGEWAPLLAQVRSSVNDFVLSIAEVQEVSSSWSDHSLNFGKWTANKRLLDDPTVAAAIREERRLWSELSLDGFTFIGDLPRRREAAQEAPVAVSVPPPMPLGAPPSGPAPQVALNRLLGPPRQGGRGIWAMGLEQRLAGNPRDMEARVGLAIARMKAGQSAEEVRRLIDAQPPAGPDDAISESHVWALPAHAFYFAGELESARHYYTKVAAIGTGSASDLMARSRLRLIAGDLAGAQQRNRARLERYESDFARRDVAGLEFLAGRQKQAWEVLAARLPSSAELELWVGAEVGHRMQGLTSPRIREWIEAADYGHGQSSGIGMSDWFLLRQAVNDRRPLPEDIAAVHARGPNHGTSNAGVQAMLALSGLAWSEHVTAAELNAVRQLLSQAEQKHRDRLKPLYAWVSWRSGERADPAVASLRAAGTDADFDSVLAKALVLGLDKQSGPALLHLRAARLELSSLTWRELDDELRSPAYMAGVVAYWLFRETGDTVYRDEALDLARSYQRIFPFLAWPYALDGLLSPEGSARTLATCRARQLDRRSLYLEMRGAAGRTSGVCPKKLW